MVRKCTVHYMSMLKQLQMDNTNLKVVHYGENEHFDEFVVKVNEEVLAGVESVG